MASTDVCSTFSLIVLLITAAWVFIGRRWTFSTLALAMFFPGLTAFVFETGNIISFAKSVLGISGDHRMAIRQEYSVVTMCVASVIIVTVTLALCAIWNTLLGWGDICKSQTLRTCFSSVHDHNKLPIVGFFRAAGEEIGWRCYLLPHLMSSYSVSTAFIASGLIWGLYHVPVMILLTHRCHVRQPWLTVIIQCLAIATSAFPHGWVAVKSGYSFWAPTVMHFTWNLLNPAVFGSIYTNTPGYILGDQLLINGEGLAGIIVGIPIALLVLWDLA